jgi:predicted nucleic acid-binding protein
MASSLFLDTNGWLALLHAGDEKHEEADRVWRDLIRRGYQVVLTDWIVAETGNGSARSRDKHRFVEAVETTIRDPRVELIVVDAELLHRSLDYYGRHQDKFWGLVDCASFIVMQERGITEAFTSDQHFEQAGFKCLLSV